MQFFLNKGTIIKCTGYAKINLINNNFLFVCNIGIYRLIVDGHTDFFFFNFETVFQYLHFSVSFVSDNTTKRFCNELSNAFH